MALNLTEWLFTHYGKEQYTPGLERTRKALETLIPSLQKLKIITVAGTNGKGETVLRLSKLLKDRSHVVWTSPHIERITERFRNSKGEISEKILSHYIQICHEKVLRNNYQLTFYEFLFFVFCSWAVDEKPEFLLLEVGLGGRLDAVNVFDADLVLLPSISRDHQEFLGNRYELILREKLGVLRPKATLISYMHLNYLRERAMSHCKSIGANFIDLESIFPCYDYEFSRRNQILSCAAYLFLLGRPLNEIEHWTFSDEALEHRGELLTVNGAHWLLYGSHNVDGLRKLIQFLRSENYNFLRPPYDAVIVTFSRRDLRDIRAMLRALKNSALGKVLVTTFDHPKAMDSPMLEELVRQEGLNFVDDIKTYVHGKNSGQFLVTGSYYFIGYFKSVLYCR